VLGVLGGVVLDVVVAAVVLGTVPVGTVVVGTATGAVVVGAGPDGDVVDIPAPGLPAGSTCLLRRRPYPPMCSPPAATGSQTAGKRLPCERLHTRDHADRNPEGEQGRDRDPPPADRLGTCPARTFLVRARLLARPAQK
jgi:hypothetical protein